MKNLTKLALIAAAVCGAGSSASALAQSTTSYNPSWYVAPSVNMLWPDKRFGVDDHGEGLGLKFGKAVSPDWDVQLGTSYARARGNNERYQQNMLGADALYMMSRKNFRPFLLIGLGAQRDKVNDSFYGERTKNSGFVNAGIGFQASFNEQWAMQADLRRAHGFLRDNDFGFNKNNNTYLTVGLIYTFDKPAAPARVAPPPEPVTEAAPPPPAPLPPPPPRFEKVTFSATELFGFNSAELHAPQPKLDEIAAALGSSDQVNNVVITGYTDRLGSSKYNQKLSERRANAVKDYLVGKGVAGERLTAVGKGEANPVVSCTEKKRSALIKCLEPNRRVEVEQIVIERKVQ
jgi:OOP family OmpA-OmpF porin